MLNLVVEKEVSEDHDQSRLLGLRWGCQMGLCDDLD